MGMKSKSSLSPKELKEHNELMNRINKAMTDVKYDPHDKLTTQKGDWKEVRTRDNK
jgi:hypothetical protein